MGIFDRIILVLYALSIAVMSAIVVLWSVGAFAVEMVDNVFMTYINGRWETAAVGIVFVLLSLRLFVAAFGSRGARTGNTIVVSRPMGNINVSVAAIEGLVVRTAGHVQGVREIKARVIQAGQGMSIKLRAAVIPETDIPVASEEIQRLISEQIKQTLGMEVVNVEIAIDNISSELKPKTRVE